MNCEAVDCEIPAFSWICFTHTPTQEAAVFSWDYDLIADGSKARRYGFHQYVESEAMFMRQFEELRARRIIPPA
jgi:hypothetical protein